MNRGFAVSGSAYNKMGTWEWGYPYRNWPYQPQRQSIWKVLWSHGITDWKIYNAIPWDDQIFTYQLYLRGQIPTIDKSVTQANIQATETLLEKDGNIDADNKTSFEAAFEKNVDPIGLTTSQPSAGESAKYLGSLNQFLNDAKKGELPAFSLVEPVWVGPETASSYHPTGDLVPAEKALNKIYNALKDGQCWDETLLVITFDKNNGLYDHVAPPYAKKPWPNDQNNGFEYDIMGPRVPTILVSPHIKKHSVFRAEGETPFDSTSFAATLLNWFGIPKPLWGLGDRIDVAPTFENVFQEASPRTDAPSLNPPFDKNNPKKVK